MYIDHGLVKTIRSIKDIDKLKSFFLTIIERIDVCSACKEANIVTVSDEFEGMLCTECLQEYLEENIEGFKKDEDYYKSLI